MGRSPFTDHRGRPINLFGIPAPKARDETNRSMPPDVHRSIERRIGNGPARLKLSGLVVSIVLTMVVLVAVPGLLSMFGASRTTVLWSVLVLVVVMAGATAVIQQLILLLVFAARITNAFLAERRCPACAYDLAGGVASDDGCTVCPECAAAWRLEPTAPSTE